MRWFCKHQPNNCSSNKSSDKTTSNVSFQKTVTDIREGRKQVRMKCQMGIFIKLKYNLTGLFTGNQIASIHCGDFSSLLGSKINHECCNQTWTSGLQSVYLFIESCMLFAFIHSFCFESFCLWLYVFQLSPNDSFLSSI